jgi:hypothetical protein
MILPATVATAATPGLGAELQLGLLLSTDLLLLLHRASDPLSARALMPVVFGVLALALLLALLLLHQHQLPAPAISAALLPDVVAAVLL